VAGGIKKWKKILDGDRLGIYQLNNYLPIIGPTACIASGGKIIGNRKRSSVYRSNGKCFKENKIL